MGLARSYRKAEVSNIGIFNDIVFAFQAELAGFLAFRLAAVNDEVIVGDHFGADETTLNIAMNLAGGLFGHRALSDGPSANFVLTGGKETDEIHQCIGGANEAVACRLVDANL